MENSRVLKLKCNVMFQMELYVQNIFKRDLYNKKGH